MAPVRAKFTVVRIERGMAHRQTSGPGEPYASEPCELRTITLSPVYSEDPASENRRFWQASPSGEIRLGTINPEAWEAFDLDRAYYVDFTPAD